MSRIIDAIFDKVADDIPDYSEAERTISEEIISILQSLEEWTTAEQYMKIEPVITSSFCTGLKVGFKIGMKYLAKLLAECLS